MRYPPDFFFLRFNHMFLLPLDHFRCSATFRNCPENGKNRKAMKWLLIAPPKNFRVREAFLFLEIFLIYFFQMFSIRCSFWISNCFFVFFLDGRSTQKRTQNQKSASENKKNDTKAGITRDSNELRARVFQYKLEHINGLPKMWC